MIISGIIVHGKQLGRKLGFPTANLCVEKLHGQMPQAGVYGAWAILPDGRQFPAMVNVGYRPTVDTTHHDLSIEAHLAGFTGDLYGQNLSLEIVERIRDEKRMESLEELRSQLTLDLQSVLALLSRH